MDSPILLSVSHAGRTVDLPLDPTSSLAALANTLSNEFDLSPTSLKLLVKGRKLSPADDVVSDLEEVFKRTFGPFSVAQDRTRPLKALLVGTKRSDLEAMQAEDALRRKKHNAFLFHQQHPARPSSRGVHSLSDSSNDPATFRFHHLEPFPTSVPFFDRRKAMLERLTEDPAVKDVMRRHRFAVGVLTELHPTLHTNFSTGEKLLGLNTNAGQKISLRLLTDDLDGLRSYNDVRRVLLHELCHNRFGGHDNDFKELNSLLNREVAAFESSPAFEPWDPPSTSSERSAEEHRLNEEAAEKADHQLRFGLEDFVDERREKAGRAAEERARRVREQGER
ncbi:WLM domain containing protein [Rhodotorula toruloides]|uniref:WLM domain containing protein n=1 Tax=Rhodotorula toruloides TaxID=5286 RepID=A0A511KAU5_RHOTO|nr:WLM domain containing protein [Rhodotorula toruloides]